MIDDQTQNAIIQATEQFWSQHILSRDFRSRATGKEVGHRIADYVEEHTVGLLDQHFTTGYQHNAQGHRMARGMGIYGLNLLASSTHSMSSLVNPVRTANRIWYP